MNHNGGYKKVFRNLYSYTKYTYTLDSVFYDTYLCSSVVLIS